MINFNNITLTEKPKNIANYKTESFHVYQYTIAKIGDKPVHTGEILTKSTDHIKNAQQWLKDNGYKDFQKYICLSDMSEKTYTIGVQIEKWESLVSECGIMWES